VSPAAFPTRYQGIPAVCGGDAGTDEERVPSALLSPARELFPPDKRLESPNKRRISKLRHLMMTAGSRRFCAGLLTFHQQFLSVSHSTCQRDQSEQFRPALLGDLDDHSPETSISSLSSGPHRKPVHLNPVPLPGATQEVCVILPKLDIPKEPISPATTDALKTHANGQSPAENCARIKDLGFKTSTHIKMYGERFELVSDPFVEGDYTAVHAISGDSRGARPLRLPVSILVGLPDLFRRKKNSERETP
jgi:hypothetical protein